MNKKTIFWLHSQLPSWKAKGWISDEVADEIMLFYSKIPSRNTPSLTRLFILVLGGILTALGIFLLFAGYWYSFSPNGRFDWSLILVLLALFIVAIAIWRAPRNSSFAEGASIFYMLSLYGATYLIGETYYLSSPVGIALLLTLLASIPVIYALEASLGLLTFLLGTMLWVFSPYAENFIMGTASVWILLLLAAPFYIHKLRNRHEGYTKLILLSWAYVAALLSAVYVTVAATQDNLNIFFMSAIAACTYGIGIVIRQEGLWTTPFKGIGTIGLLYVIIKGSYINTWNMANLPIMTTPIVVVGILVLILTVVILREVIKARQFVDFLICLAPIIVLACHLLTWTGTIPLIISVLFNVYVILIAILLFIRGGVAGRVGKVNGAFLILLALVLARFTDTAFTFIERGATFIFVGLGLIVVNAIYMWNKNRKVRDAVATIEQNRKDRQIKVVPAEVVDVDAVITVDETTENTSQNSDLQVVDAGTYDVVEIEPQQGKTDAIEAARAERDKEVTGFRAHTSPSRPVLPDAKQLGEAETFSEFLTRQERGGHK